MRAFGARDGGSNPPGTTQNPEAIRNVDISGRSHGERARLIDYIARHQLLR